MDHHSIFNSDYYTIHGNHNIINGDYCTVYGDHNVVNGDGCEVHGQHNIVNGDHCQVTPGNIINGSLCVILLEWEDGERTPKKERNRGLENYVDVPVEGEEDREACSICYEYKRAFIFKDCGHFKICGACAKKLTEGGTTLASCTECRKRGPLQRVFQ